MRATCPSDLDHKSEYFVPLSMGAAKCRDSTWCLPLFAVLYIQCPCGTRATVVVWSWQLREGLRRLRATNFARRVVEEMPYHAARPLHVVIIPDGYLFEVR